MSDGLIANLYGAKLQKKQILEIENKVFDYPWSRNQLENDIICKVNVENISADFATSFEVFEHVYSPENFLKSVRKILKPRGIFLFTTLTIDGFDLQVLWSKSKIICPPLHINFFSKRGFGCLLEKCGFSLIEISTPGRLDVDIVLNASKENKNLKLPRFFRHLLDVADDDARGAFQTFLRDNLLSSHVMVIAQKI